MQATAAQYDSALLLYGRALQLQPNDMAILNAAKHVAQLSNRDAMRKFYKSFNCYEAERSYSSIITYYWAFGHSIVEKRIPWVGAGIGIIIGVTIVIADYVFTKAPTLTVRPHSNEFENSTINIKINPYY